jgi:hypothetical protein
MYLYKSVKCVTRSEEVKECEIALSPWPVSRQLFVGSLFRWLVRWFGDSLLVKSFWAYGIICIYKCIYCITVSMVMLLRDFGYYGIIFITVCFCTLDAVFSLR